MEGWPWVVPPQRSVQPVAGMFLLGIELRARGAPPRRAVSPAVTGSYCTMTEPRIMFIPQVNGIVPAAGVRGTSTG